MIGILLANGVTYSKAPKKIWITYRSITSVSPTGNSGQRARYYQRELDEIFATVLPANTKKPGQRTGGSGIITIPCEKIYPDAWWIYQCRFYSKYRKHVHPAYPKKETRWSKTCMTRKIVVVEDDQPILNCSGTSPENSRI